MTISISSPIVLQHDTIFFSLFKENPHSFIILKGNTGKFMIKGIFKYQSDFKKSDDGFEMVKI